MAASSAQDRNLPASARKLEKQVEAAVNDLAMKATFKIEVTGSDEEGNWTPGGFDHVVYMKIGRAHV